jgi:CO/xanthine dehydrogenase FAD-binding subunit
LEYYKPETLKEAVKLKESSKNNYFLGGGTELNSLAQESLKIEALINLEKSCSDKITENQIGAMAVLQDIIENPAAPKGIKDAARHVNNRNIRNAATIGGNLGANKASSDLIGTLIVMKAVLEIITSDGKDEITVKEWIKSPKGLISVIKFPAPSRKVFHRRFSRTKNDIPTVKFTAGFTKNNDETFTDIVIAAGSVAEKVVTMDKTSDYLNGKAMAHIKENEITALIKKDINPIDDHRASADYRIKLVAAAVNEFLHLVPQEV